MTEEITKTKADKQNKEDKIEDAPKPEEKQELKKEASPAPIQQMKQKKEEAIAKSLNLHSSKKHCMYICNFIKNKSIDRAIQELQEVIKLKRIIPFKGEIPHRKGPGIMSGRYPVKTSKCFIYILKALKGNAIVNGLDLDKTRIYIASASWDSRPSRKGGARFKRSYVLLKAKEMVKNQSKKGDKK